MRFAHTNIIGTNWKVLVEFYINTFDCKIVPPIRKQSGEWLENAIGLKNAKLEGAHLLLPGYREKGPTLEIFQYENVEKQESIAPNKRGFGHIAFEVESIEILEQTKKDLENKGLDVLGLTDHGVFKSIYFFDPNGHRLELCANTGTVAQMKTLKEIAPEMLEEWSRTKKPPRQASWLHDQEFLNKK